LKIVYVIDYIYSVTGGTERQLYMLIEGMVERGHEVKLYVFRDTEFTRNLTGFPCPVECLGIESVLSFSCIRRLYNFRQEMIKGNIDVVHGYFNDVALALPPLMIGTNIRTFTSRRDMGIWYTPAILFILRVFRFTRATLICNSLAVARMVGEKEWKPDKAIRVIYNGMERSKVKGAAGCDWAPARGDMSGVINIVLVANVRPVKRIDDLIKAAKLLRDRQCPVQYYVVGNLLDEPYVASLFTQLHDYQLEDCFHFIGSVKEPRAGLSQFDIGVLTSESEGFSNSIMEYLDAGLPVVASRVGGNPELVADGLNGFLYEAGNVRQLAECLYKLVSDDTMRSNLAKYSKDIVMRFDKNAMVENHEKAYAQA